MNKSIPKVSILISVYNGAPYISRCLKSLLNQSFKDFEIVIIDDGSTDDTVSLIQAFDDLRIKLIEKEHTNLPHSLNIGLAKCKGQYIARMDADDWSYPQRIELQSNFLDKNPATGVISGLVSYEGNRENNEGYALHVDWANEQLTYESILLSRFQDSPVINPSVMFRKTLITLYGDYRVDTTPEDYEFWLRMLHEGVRIEKLNTYVLKWNDLPSRLTRNHENYSQHSFMKIKTEYVLKWIKHEFEQPARIYVFGAGKTINRRVRPLLDMGLSVEKYLDVVKPAISAKHVIYYKDLLPPSEDTLVLSFVSDRIGKKRIHSFLQERGYKEGINYLMMM